MIERCREAFPIRMMCRALQVSPSGFYDWRSRPPSARTQSNQQLLERIQSLHAASDGVLGRRRLCEDLVDEGERCSPNRVGRLMQEAGLKGIPQKKKWQKKLSGIRPGTVENHLARDFSATQANDKWVTDITFGAPNLGRRLEDAARA
jgi:putative transposase